MDGPSPSLDPGRAAALADRQGRVFAALNREAGLPESGPASQAEWRRFLVAGLSAADEECDAYIRALREVEVERRRAVRQTNIVGTTVAAIMGIAEAAAGAIAITASAFGLTQATIDNYLGSLVYELPHDTVRSLVENLRQSYEASLRSEDWVDRSTTFRTLRGYVELCTPAVIEANVRAAVQGARIGQQGERTDFSRPRIGVLAAAAAEGPRSAGGSGSPGAPVAPPARPVGLPGAQSDFERSILRGSLAEYREQLCLPATPTAFDAEFRRALEMLRGDPTVTGPFTARDRARLTDLPGPCNRELFRNVFERRSWQGAGGVGVDERRLQRLWSRLRRVDPALQPEALPLPPDLTASGPLRQALLRVVQTSEYTLQASDRLPEDP